MVIETTYRTFSGIKKILELPKKRSTQWIVYQDDKPKYFVDLFDLTIESNAMMNSLVLCAKKPMKEVLEAINKRNNIKLSLAQISKLGFSKKIKSVPKEVHLEPLPEKWLAYSF